MRNDTAAPAARRVLTGVVATILTSLGTVSIDAFADDTASSDDSSVQRGRYLVQIAGCNDCHTPGYMETAGKVDEQLWLTGTAVGWNGPWGTTYPSNLRLVAAKLTDAQWLVYARREWLPPMPWFALRDMTDDDVKSIYHYLRHLGPAGKPAPTALAPGQEPDAPVFQAPAPPPPPK